MQNKNKRILERISSRNKIYIALIFVLLIILSVQNTFFIVPSIVFFILLLSYTYYANGKKRIEISETLQDLTLSVDTAAKTTLVNSPFPLIIVENDGNVIWKSKSFSQEFANIDIISHVTELITEIETDLQITENNIDNLSKKDITKGLDIFDKKYKVISRVVNYKNKHRSSKKGYMHIMTFVDDTESQKLQEEYRDSKSCIALIIIDNYEEIAQRLNNDDKPQVLAEIDKHVFEWADKTNGVLIKSDRDKYVYLFEQRYLETLKEDKFSILDKIKDMDINENFKFTLSIAVSNEGITDKDKYKSAQTALELVLGRGGDQAVIRENEIYKFFGGKSEEVEKRTKVKARIMAHSLENLIKDSERVMIMGHKNPDIDCIGSAMGVYRLAKTLGRNAYIVNEEKTETLEAYRKSVEKEEEYDGVFIDKELALENIDENTLLVIVDVHRKDFVEVPELLEYNAKIVVIDHHRRSTGYIKNVELLFQEVYASSACELVTELIQHAEAKVELKTLEAESLYAGIMMDTKNFLFKTGVRTFEAAAYLRKCGIDIIKVKKWFQNDLREFTKVADIVTSAEIVNDTIAISIYEEEDKNANLVSAKAADELLSISTITASFVLSKMENTVYISGRSIGDINVQMILEKLGGGGHITLAGAQMQDVSLEDAKQKLNEKIIEYFNEQK